VAEPLRILFLRHVHNARRASLAGILAHGRGSYALERDYGILPWAQFVEFVNLRFGPPIQSNPLDELKELHRTGTVEDYQRQFLQLLCRCDGLSPTHQMNLFTPGLGEPMTSDVEMQRPADLQAAMSLARAFERRDTAAATPPTQAPRSQYRPHLPTTSSTSSAASNASATPSPGSTHSRFRRLSPEEMADKRKKGECYFCPEKFTPDHKCTMKGVFLMELTEEDLADLVDDLGISLHALTGLSSANTMQLMITIAGTELRALIDSGSTHTFIHDAVVHSLGLDIVHQPGLSVKVANGERLQSYGACKATTVTIQGDSFVVDCYTLPLEGFDVILGIQWLQSLGRIMWDFKALSMAFVREGRSVRFIGCGGTPCSLYSVQLTDNLLDTLLTAYVDIFDEPRGLPPQRQHDHKMHLLPGTTPVAVRPYRYPQLLKDEVERQ
jgi:hypothetical protein